jgi:predicted subunit of tRNA(5-methylaminomethyl-2-thiouridylate) methyltransferase
MGPALKSGQPGGAMCARCVLTTSIPGVSLDAHGVCVVCREYEAKKTVYDAYFGNEADLKRLLDRARQAGSDYDVVLMYSGGKDSTYMLYRIVEMGYRALALTFDNGYIPQGCFENIRGVCQDLGVESVVLSVPKKEMDEAFGEGLKIHKTVCTSCFRGLTARGTELAIERKIPYVMTGLSRGQIYDTKVHMLMKSGITDATEIERYLHQFRRSYHMANDKISRLIEDRSLRDPAAFERVEFVDYYRYCDATKKEITAFIQQRAPFWRKPDNVGGCSSNCMINDVGIKTHMEKKGYHNYAIPTAWEIRFGHLTREEALEELGAPIDDKRVAGILKMLVPS